MSTFEDYRFQPGRVSLLILLALGVMFSFFPLPSQAYGEDLTWQTSYSTAYRLANTEHRPLFILISLPESFDADQLRVIQSDELKSRLRQGVCLHITATAKARLPKQGTVVPILEHPAMKGFSGKPGLAVYNMVDPDSKTYKKLVYLTTVSSQDSPTNNLDGLVSFIDTTGWIKKAETSTEKPTEISTAISTEINTEKSTEISTEIATEKPTGISAVEPVSVPTESITAEPATSPDVVSETSHAASEEPTGDEVHHAAKPALDSSINNKESISDTVAGKQPFPELNTSHLATFTWLTDFNQAMERAIQEKEMLLILLTGKPGQEAFIQKLERNLLHSSNSKSLEKFTCVKIPWDSVITFNGVESPILKHKAMAEMHNSSGLIIIDYANTDKPFYGQVVSVFPKLRTMDYQLSHISAILNLPPATLTQRTLTFAIRVHPHKPLSANGNPNHTLLSLAKEHAIFQARTHQVGHANFSSRANRVVRAVPRSMPSEICAQPVGGRLVESALGCAQLWRNSSGHWPAMKSPSKAWGYDMVKSSSGVWYGVGIFGK